MPRDPIREKAPTQSQKMPMINRSVSGVSGQAITTALDSMNALVKCHADRSTLRLCAEGKNLRTLRQKRADQPSFTGDRVDHGGGRHK
ncbi:MAG: hypothetical protein ACKOQ8_01305 [Micrococcales bacterium]